MRLLLIVFCWLPVISFAQIGGRHVYDFLNLSPGARIAALGGVNITTYDYDGNFGYQNPALVNDSMSKQVSMSFVNYITDISYGYASYAHSFEGIADFHAGVQYLSYGKMKGADEYGNLTGEFGASDVAFVVGGSKMIDNFRMGLNMKLINSNIQGYRSYWAMGFDLGGLYVSDSKLFTAGMVFKNIGFNFSNYNLPEDMSSPLPFQIQMGMSAKLKHMPLRFSATVTNLETPNLVYKDPNPEIEYDLAGEEIVPKKNIPDKIFRHFVFGTEFLLSPNFHLRAGYNHLRRAELKSINRAGISGFSFGGGIRIMKFRFDYGFTGFHASGNYHSFSLATNIGDFKKKSGE